jgi:peptide chain release factor 1
MLDKLQALKERFIEVGQLIIQPDSMSDMSKYTKLNKEYRDLEKVVNLYDEYKLVKENISSTKEILEKEKDPDFREMAKIELDELKQREEELEEALRQQLIPKDPNDSKDCILEIRGGTGGDEAAIFAGDLFRMYQRFCEKKGWKLTVLDLTFGSSGGYKEIISTITGEDVYGMMKYESGVHRVQRVPQTETQGRVHTSTVTVAVLPEAEDVDVDLKPGDLRIETCRAGGAGGQHVNRTESAVQVFHLPTGLYVRSEDGRSQHQNKEKALEILRARLYEMKLREQQAAYSSHRRSIIGSGDRSEKIRTYNFPQSRVTDHRIGFTSHDLAGVLEGRFDEFTHALQRAEMAERLADA